jgi:hypothetical protein
MSRRPAIGVLIGFIFLCQSGLMASKVPDFSGVFLRTTIASHSMNQAADPPPSTDTDPVVLEVRQKESGLEVTSFQNGASTTAYYLDNEPSVNQSYSGQQRIDRARLDNNSLTIKSEMGTDPAGPDHKRTVEQVWTLSADAKTLTIERQYELAVHGTLAGKRTETYVRQGSISAALAAAEAVSRRLNCTAGSVSFRQLDRCVSFSALLYRASNGTAEKTERGPEDRPSAGVLVLQVDPKVSLCPEWGFPQPAAGILPQQMPSEFTHLRFKLRWRGADTRDLGEWKSELLCQPWRELGPSDCHYQLEVPAKSISPEDELEVRILSESRQPMACVRTQLSQWEFQP